MTVDLGKLPGRSARVSWYDPTTGKVRAATDHKPQGRKELTAPSAQSWVLRVESKQ